MRTLLSGFLTVLLLALNACGPSDFTEDFDKLKESSTDTGGSGSSSDACPVGTWRTPTCGGSSGKFLIYYFASDGTGYSLNPECTGLCSGPLKFYIRYTKTSNSINYTFTKTDPVTCNGTTSTPPVPSGNYTINYTCGNNGNQLTIETANMQTGARNTQVFTRM